MPLMSDAMGKATSTMSGALQQVVERLGGPSSPAPARHRLSVQQQLNRFARMTDADFERIREQKGEREFYRYVEAMTRMTRREN